MNFWAFYIWLKIIALALQPAEAGTTTAVEFWGCEP